MYVDSLLRLVPLRHTSRKLMLKQTSCATLRRRSLATGSATSYQASFTASDSTSTSPFILQSQSFLSDYERGINLSARIIHLCDAELEAEKQKIEEEFSRTPTCANSESFVETQIHNFRENILSQVFTENKTINEITQFILGAKSKLFRPKLGFMVAKVLSEYLLRVKAPGVYGKPPVDGGRIREYGLYAGEDVMKRVTRLLQSYEIVHAGSLIHDDIVDDAETRRNQPAVHLKMGTKISVLVGDLMLTRACSTVANLGSQQSTVRMAKALENLIKGELLDVKSSMGVDEMLKVYLQKIFLKTASLIAECCASIADLFGLDSSMCHNCYMIGLHVGMAFQIYDDLLDYRSHSSSLGKPALNDISSGLITLPLIFALPESEELGTMLKKGDITKENIEQIMASVRESKSFERSQFAVMLHLSELSKLLKKMGATEVAGESALTALSQLLLRFVYDTLTRTKG